MIVERNPRSDLPNIDKKKFLVPSDLSGELGVGTSGPGPCYTKIVILSTQGPCSGLFPADCLEACCVLICEVSYICVLSSSSILPPPPSCFLSYPPSLSCLSVVSQLQFIIRRRISLPAEKAMFFFVGKGVLMTNRC